MGDGVFRYLVRYGAPGFVGWFGTIHTLQASRGDQVVLATDRGLELGEVLLGPGDETEQPSVSLTGEVLRVANDDDLRRAAELRIAHLPWLERCRQLLGERRIQVAVVDGEALLDGQRIILYYAGEATAQLGPLAVELGGIAGDLHVKFQPLDVADSSGAMIPLPLVATSEESAEDAVRLTRQERIKAGAANHWTAIAAAMSDPTQDRLSRDDAFLLQLHGAYQQEDRDRRESRAAAAAPAAVARRRFFMIRTKPPGGRLTAGQLLTQLDLADRFGDGSVRITSRQGLQLHGVSKEDVREVLPEIEASLLSTLGACGDVARNVMCCPAPLRHDRVRLRLQSIAAEIARHLTPKNLPFYEIWLGEERAADAASDAEPLYGPTYLPRKFKVGIALPEDNCVDVHTQDLGLLACVEGETLAGFNVLVGGGLGSSLQREDTFPRLAEPLAFVPAGEELRAIDAIVGVLRVHGNRSDRRRARLKYLVAEWGLPRFKAAVEEVLERDLAPPRAIAVSGCDDHLGWQDQGDGRSFLGLPIPNGRLKDVPDSRLKTALRTILSEFRPAVRLTPQQNLLLCDLSTEQREAIEAVLSQAGVAPVERMSPLRRRAMACPALPTCGLALAEAERVTPRLLERLQAELDVLGLGDEPLALRIAGCPNSCVRTATAEIALSGRGPGRYDIRIGGSVLGTRLNYLHCADVPEDRIVATVLPLFARFRAERQRGERFGDYCARHLERFSHSAAASGD